MDSSIIHNPLLKSRADCSLVSTTIHSEINLGQEKFSIYKIKEPRMWEGLQ